MTLRLVPGGPEAITNGFGSLSPSTVVESVGMETRRFLGLCSPIARQQTNPYIFLVGEHRLILATGPLYPVVRKPLAIALMESSTLGRSVLVSVEPAACAVRNWERSRICC